MVLRSTKANEITDEQFLGRVTPDVFIFEVVLNQTIGSVLKICGMKMQ